MTTQPDISVRTDLGIGGGPHRWILQHHSAYIGPLACLRHSRAPIQYTTTKHKPSH